MEVVIPDGYVSGSFEYETSVGTLERRVIRHDSPGPTAILIHEAPGLSKSTFDIADVFLKQGYRVVLPVLLDAAWSWKGIRPTVGNMLKLCVSRELSALAAGQTGAIVEWLRGLADEESQVTAGRPVGVIGMCFSGGFALGTITNPHVSAAVMSQPALPFMLPLPFRASDLGVSKDDLRVIHERVGTGSCIRAMRFSRDRVSPRKRLDLIRKEFPDAECVEIQTSERLHSVLAKAVERPEDPQLAAALRDTVAFLDRHLKGTSSAQDGTGSHLT
jgi:dienelactone hydrolase